MPGLPPQQPSQKGIYLVSSRDNTSNSNNGPSFRISKRYATCTWSINAQTHACTFSRLCLKCDGTRTETRFRLSAKRTSPFKSAGASVQSTAGSRGVRISGSNAVYTMLRGSVRVLATHPIYQFPLHFPSCASCAIRFQTHSTYNHRTLQNPKGRPSDDVELPLKPVNLYQSRK